MGEISTSYLPEWRFLFEEETGFPWLYFGFRHSPYYMVVIATVVRCQLTIRNNAKLKSKKTSARWTNIICGLCEIFVRVIL